MKGIYEIERLIISHKIDFDTIEVVLHSYNILAKEYRSNNDREKEMECYSKKEIIMEYLLNPVEIHIIKEKKYLVYEGLNHRFHEPFDSLTKKERELYSQILATKILYKTEYSGERIHGNLSKETCDEFYYMVIENNFVFDPLN